MPSSCCGTSFQILYARKKIKFYGCSASQVYMLVHFVSFFFFLIISEVCWDKQMKAFLALKSVIAAQVVSLNIFLRLDNCALRVSSGICLRFYKKLTRYASALYRCGSSAEWTGEKGNELPQMWHRGMGCRASIEICLQYIENFYSRNIPVKNTRLILSLHHAVDITSIRISSSACLIQKY